MVKEQLAKPKIRAGVNLETDDGVTALRVAAEAGADAVVRLLLEAGANVNQTMRVRCGNGLLQPDVPADRSTAWPVDHHPGVTPPHPLPTKRRWGVVWLCYRQLPLS